MAVRVRPANRRAVPSRALRRRRVWARDSDTLTPVAAGVTSDLLADYKTAAGITANPPGVTVGGILLDMGIVQTASRAASTDGIKIGIICVNEATAAEVARPVADAHADWMWYQWIPAPGAATGAQNSTFVSLGGPIHIRSRRRMDELGMNLFFVAQLVGTTTYDMTLETSTLLLLP